MFLGLPDQDSLVKCTDPAPDPAPDPYVLSGKFSKQCTIFYSLKSIKERSRIQSQIRIHQSEVWVRGSGPGSTPKCYRSPTLVKLAQTGEGRGCTPTPFHYVNYIITYKVVVYAPAERGRYPPPHIFPLLLYVLGGISYFLVQQKKLCVFICLMTSREADTQV